MNEGKDIVGISVPFTAGVSFAALCSVYCTKILENSFIIFWLPGIAFFLCCALIVFSLLTRPRKYVFYIVLFLALGCFCYINGNITVSLRKDAGGLAAMAEKSATRVKAVIESIPYTNEETTVVVKALTTGDKSGLGRATTGTFRRSGDICLPFRDSILALSICYCYGLRPRSAGPLPSAGSGACCSPACQAILQ